MARPLSSHPTDGELEILNILWEHGPSPLGEICSALRETRPLATTTVATMLKLMLDKQLVKKSEGDKGYVWSARLTRQSAKKSFVRKLLDRAFDGSAQHLVAHLFEAGHLSEKDREEIRKLLDHKPEKS
jgi:BlaI family penicillinase repressor